VSLATPCAAAGIRFENGAILGDSSGNGSLGLADYDFGGVLARFFVVP
jgi:hypothetical protein